MPLYSTDPHSNAMENIADNEPNTDFGSGRELVSERQGELSWCYLFVHNTKMEYVNSKLEEKFNTFVHKSIVYKRKQNRIKKLERPTISGLLFVQGNCNEVQEYLTNIYSGLYLVKDCSTRKVAVISNRVMQAFIQIAGLSTHRIRFMPNPFEYYSAGHPLVRVTSGVLAGIEGYQVRISRDKCLVTSVGGITIAIGGVNRESFENVDVYVRHRRAELHEEDHSNDMVFTPFQQEIDQCFFTPQNQLDLMAIAHALDAWILRARIFVNGKKYKEAIEVSLFLLEEVGSRFRSIYNKSEIGDFKDITDVCSKADNILLGMTERSDISEDFRLQILTERQSLAIRYAFLPMDV